MDFYVMQIPNFSYKTKESLDFDMGSDLIKNKENVKLYFHATHSYLEIADKDQFPKKVPLNYTFIDEDSVVVEESPADNQEGGSPTGGPKAFNPELLDYIGGLFGYNFSKDFDEIVVGDSGLKMIT